MSDASTLVWFRLDLRLRDNPALAAALARGSPVVPVYIRDDAGEGAWPPGGASRWWLHHSLVQLEQALQRAGLRLVLARGESRNELLRLARECGAAAVTWNNRREPAAARQDDEIAAVLEREGLAVRRFRSGLLFEPEAITNRAGGPFQVFTPFWRRCREMTVAPPLRTRGGRWPGPRRWPPSLALADLGLLPVTRWDAGLAATWQPGEDGAHRRLRRFMARTVDDYASGRDRPDLAATSGLSPHLHFGEITPRQIWAAAAARGRTSGVFPDGPGAQVFLKELGWREFAYHLLHHFPRTPERPLRNEFRRFAWRRDPAGLAAWKRGRTGYPIVDAGMRQLWQTGWMHNRVRMIVASFLVKDLRISWRRGAAWFWDTLVDADLANNTLGWQWSAGCGADAAPYFRIFNPVRQGRRFDPTGDYVRHWVPGLAALPTEWIHAPWEAPPGVLADAGIRLGDSYPLPIVNHDEARSSALAAYRGLRDFR